MGIFGRVSLVGAKFIEIVICCGVFVFGDFFHRRGAGNRSLRPANAANLPGLATVWAIASRLAQVASAAPAACASSHQLHQVTTALVSASRRYFAGSGMVEAVGAGFDQHKSPLK